MSAANGVVFDKTTLTINQIDRKIGDRVISESLHNVGLAPSEIRLSRVDQAGQYIIVETCLQEIDRDKLAELVKCNRFKRITTVYSTENSIWFFFSVKR